MTLSFEQIKLIFEAEQERIGEKLRDTAQLPIAFESLTNGWLTSALCRGHAGAEVTQFSLIPVVEGTTNRRMIHLEYNEAGRQAGLPGRVFCKASHGLANRYALGVSGAAKTEVMFYNRLRPLLQNVNAPVGVYADFDANTYNSLVILKDLTDEVAEFCTQDTVVTRARAEDMAGLLARLHGQSYGNPAIVEQLQHFASWPEYFDRTLMFGMREGSEEGFARAGDLIPARLHRRAGEIWPATIKAVRLNDHLPPTLAHGDVHLKNWYITTAGAMALSDWQCLTRSYWARDFGYALGTALSIEDRRLWERDLLLGYLDQLHAAGGPRIGFDQAWLHYRQHLISALTWWTITFNPAPGMPDMQPMATSREFVKRLSTAMDDLETLDSLD